MDIKILAAVVSVQVSGRLMAWRRQALGATDEHKIRLPPKTDLERFRKDCRSQGMLGRCSSQRKRSTPAMGACVAVQTGRYSC